MIDPLLVLLAAILAVGALLLYRSQRTCRAAREELAAVRPLLDQIQTLAHCGYWRLDLNTRALEWSDEMRRVNGVPMDYPITEETTRQLSLPEDFPKVLAAFQQALAHPGQAIALIARVCPPGSGAIRYLDSRMRAECDAEGRACAILGTSLDITDRVVAENALRESRSMLAEAQQLSGVGHWYYRMGEPGLHWSEQLFNLFGLPVVDEAISVEATLARIHPDDRPRVQEAMTHAGQSPQTMTLMFRVFGPGGAIRLHEARIRGEFDAQGKVVALLGASQDVTERRRIEQTLRRNARILEQAEALAKMGSWERDIDSGEGFWSNGLYRLYGRSPDAGPLRFAESGTIIVPEDFARLEECKRRMIEHHEPFDILVEVQEPSGESRYLRMVSEFQAADADGGGLGDRFLGVIQDVTDMKRTEQALHDLNESLEQRIRERTRTLAAAQEQLIQTEKMASLGNLVAGISHEINTPLGIGMTAATSIQEDLQKLHRHFQAGTMKRSALDAFITHSLQGSEILVQHLKRAADLVASFKQVAADQSSDAWRTIDVHDYLDEIIRSLHPRIKPYAVEVVNACPREIVLRTHPGALYQIFSNLILNALSHGFEPRTAGTIRIDARREDGILELRCEDTGKGIAPDIQKHVFDPFFTTRRGSGGTGLGLNIVYNLVTGTLGGTIRLQSEPGRGTALIIRIPTDLGGKK
ncbi:hypothetical protein B9N43_14185 [Denitratisoma sp. DHT3]|uniref:PAS domain-containing sensor histidine kinase n=1 Tax=Denitratisoma sp. DHT3 TaxID=1981880 RepID=UPI001198AA4A|nr:PAS domain-containing sensor histidine kinase [Denitratisoma sp. DHT3]QDX82288.1 hypothetical protein B9N43_14185 [Denitratisoma sp. DHT3]